MDISVTIAPVNISVSASPSTVHVTFSGCAPGMIVEGDYLDDDAAVLAGKTVGKLYFLEENNNYSLPAGLVKKII